MKTFKRLIATKTKKAITNTKANKSKASIRNVLPPFVELEYDYPIIKSQKQKLKQG